jgi:hypothetical protein
MRRLAISILGATIAVSAASAASGSSATIERFRTLVHATKETSARAEPDAKVSEGLSVIGSINDAQEFSPFLPSSATAKLKAADYGRVFVLATFVLAPVQGYSIDVRRVSLVRNSRHRRQFCVTAVVRRPATSVSTGHGWVGAHLILLSARPFRTGPVSWSFPSAWVLRTPAGAVLAISREPIGSTGTSRATGQPAACR